MITALIGTIALIMLLAIRIKLATNMALLLYRVSEQSNTNRVPNAAPTKAIVVIKAVYIVFYSPVKFIRIEKDSILTLKEQKATPN